MNTPNSGKLVLANPSRSSIPHLMKLIERLLREGRINDVHNILTNMEKQMRLDIGTVKLEPEDVSLEKKLLKSEKEREDLKVQNTKLADEKKELIARVNERDKIICELNFKVSEKDQTLDVYQEKIKLFDLRVTKLNMELFKFWVKRSEAQGINEEMRSKLSEAHQNEKRLKRKLIESDKVIKDASRANFEAKVGMERMKRKLPETDESVEELKRQRIEAFQIVENLSRRQIEATIAMKNLKSEKLEADRVLQVHKNWFETLAPIIKNVGQDLGIFLNENVHHQAGVGSSKGHK